MLILKLDIKNFKAIDHLTIDANQRDVLIQGQNGTGKSSIFDAYTWALTGKLSNGSTPSVDDIKHINSTALPCVSVTFDAFKITRAVGDKRDTLIAFDDTPIKTSELSIYLEPFLPRGSLDLLVNAFSFIRMNNTQRRSLLLSLVSVSDEDVFKTHPTLKPLKPLIEAKSIADIMKTFKADVKRFKQSLIALPARIDENSHYITDLAAIDADDLKFKLSELEHAAVSKSNLIFKLREQLKAIPDSHRSDDIRSNIKLFQSRIAQIERSLQALRDDFVKERARSDSDICPSCGQKIPRARIAAIKRERLQVIQQRGLAKKELRDTVADSIVKLQQELEQLPPPIDTSTLNKQIVSARADFDAINKQITDINIKLNQIQHADSIRARIDKLKSEEKDINAQLLDAERFLDLAVHFVNAKIKITEDAINAKFQRVKFKMFDVCINGNVKDVCVPTLNGIDFDNLSCGERFAVAVDILSAFNKYFGVCMPVFIDDAESFTSNSIATIEQQTFTLRVVDGINPIHITFIDKNI